MLIPLIAKFLFAKIFLRGAGNLIKPFYLLYSVCEEQFSSALVDRSEGAALLDDAPECAALPAQQADRGERVGLAVDLGKRGLLLSVVVAFSPDVPDVTAVRLLRTFGVHGRHVALCLAFWREVASLRREPVGRRVLPPAVCAELAALEEHAPALSDALQQVGVRALRCKLDVLFLNDHLRTQVALLLAAMV